MAANVNKKERYGNPCQTCISIYRACDNLFLLSVLVLRNDNNATRSNGELQSGFTAIPSTHLLDNWNSLLHDTLPVIRGMFNSLL